MKKVNSFIQTRQELEKRLVNMKEVEQTLDQALKNIHLGFESNQPVFVNMLTAKAQAGMIIIDLEERLNDVNSKIDQAITN